MKRAHLVLAIGLAGLAAAVVAMIVPVRARGTRLAVAEALARSLTVGKSGLRHRTWDGAGAMSIDPGVDARGLSYCGVVVVSGMRKASAELANCGKTVVECVGPEDQVVVPCRAVEIRELEPGAAPSGGTQEEPRCSGGYFGPLTCSLSLGGFDSRQTVQLVIR